VLSWLMDRSLGGRGLEQLVSRVRAVGYNLMLQGPGPWSRSLVMVPGLGPWSWSNHSTRVGSSVTQPRPSRTQMSPFLNHKLCAGMMLYIVLFLNITSKSYYLVLFCVYLDAK